MKDNHLREMGNKLGEQFIALREFSTNGVGRLGQDVRSIENPSDSLGLRRQS